MKKSLVFASVFISVLTIYNLSEKIFQTKIKFEETKIQFDYSKNGLNGIFSSTSDHRPEQALTSEKVPEIQSGVEFVSNEIILTFDKNASDAEKANARELVGASSPELVRALDENTEVVTISSELDVAEAMKLVATSAAVIAPEPNYLLEPTAVANDPAITDGTQWGMLGPNSTPSNEFGANAAGAWNKGYVGSNKTYVVVIDTGIDVSHPDLKDNIWVNQAEANGVTGTDDDGNGYVDDVNGFDFANYDGSVFDNATVDKHGTHVAGVIGASSNNAIGVSGVNWDTNIISAKFIGSGGSGTTANAIAAVNYATMLRTKMGLNIVATNNSWGGYSYSRALLDAIKRGGDAGILFVAASGNSASNNDSKGFYPAGYNCATTLRNWDCVISVGSIKSDGSLSSFSNYGKSTVDLVAPGSDIMSTIPGDYALSSGTSMAAPFVTGAVTLCNAVNRGMPASSAKDALLNSVTKTDALSNFSASGGLLNIENFVQGCAQTNINSFYGYPGTMTSTAMYTNLIHLNWIDSTSGEYGHQILFSKGPAGCTGEFVHFAYIGPGLTSYPAAGLDEASFYCFKIIALKDAAKSASRNSNLEITWTSNLPFIYGQVLTSEGLPVSNAQVNWTDSNTNFTISTPDITTRTNEEGEYVIQVAPSSGTIWISTPDSEPGTNSRHIYPTPSLPSSFRVGGTMTVGQDDMLLDLVLPKIDEISVKVTDPVTGSVAPGIRVSASIEVLNCEAPKTKWVDTTYRLFPGAGEPKIATGCNFWGLSGRSSFVVTNSEGIAKFPVVSSSLYKSTYKLSITNPNSPSQIGNVVVNNSDPSIVNEVTLPIMRTISGKVLHADGSPATGVSVRWTSDAALWSYQPTIATTSGPDGAYSLQVSATPGLLWVQSPLGPFSATENISANLPAGFNAGGSLLAEPTDREIDLTLPKFTELTIKVKDELTGAPLAGAKIQSTNRNVNCQNPYFSSSANNYKLFPDAKVSKISSGCMFHLGTYSGRTLTANSNGELKVTVLDSSVFKAAYTFTAMHPTDISRISGKTFSLATDGNVQEILVLGKTNVTGIAKLPDGQVVKDLLVTWTPDSWVWTGGGTASAYTDAEGRYTLRIAPGAGTLWVSTPERPSGIGQPLRRPSPDLPFGFQAGGSLIIGNVDLVKDLTLPPVRTVEVQVVDAHSLEPVQNAEVRTVAQAPYYCEKPLPDSTNRLVRNYKLFDGMTINRVANGCRFWINSWNSNYFLATDSQGKAKVTMIDDSLYRTQYSIGAVHNLDAARRVIMNFSANNDVTLQTLVLPGTPSKPERPSAIPDTDQVTLTWHEPWNGGANIDYYEVHQALNVDGPYTLVTQGTCAGHINPTWRSCVVTGLNPGTQYYFAIVAHNEVGYGEGAVLSVATLNEQNLQPTPSLTPSPTASPSASSSPLPTFSPTPAPTISDTPTPMPSEPEFVTPSPTPSTPVEVTPSITPSPENSIAPEPVVIVPVQGPRQAVGAIETDMAETVKYVPMAQVQPAVVSQSAISVKSKISFTQLLSDAGVTVSNKQTVKVSVIKTSAKFCKVAGKSVVAIKTGSCQISIKVSPKPKFKKSVTTFIKTWTIKVG